MRRAAALPTVLFALCLIGALTVGGAHVSRRAVADARVDQRALELGQAAEEALAEFVAGWDPDTIGELPVMGVRAAPLLVRRGVRVQVWESRLPGDRYWLVAEASEARKPFLQKRLGVLLRADSLGVQPAPEVAWFELPDR